MLYMRWICYVLIIVNLLFFGWHNFIGRDVDPLPSSEVMVVDGNVARIRLLTEVGEGGDTELEKRQKSKKCDVYGPFFSAPDSAAFLAVVKKAGLIGWKEKDEVRLKPYYWAYVPPQSSSRKAYALVNRLRGDQLNAEYIDEGRLRKGISLGNFESMESIESLQGRLAKIEVIVKFERKSRDYKQFWVLLNPGSEAEMSVELRDDLIAHFPNVFHQEKVCKPVASG